MKRISYLFFLVMLASATSFGQTSTVARTLLWRISGNGLAKASYLYGTIHLTDKRVFQFTDSMYRALENTEGFAAEIDMNTLGMKAINEVMAERDAKMAKEKVRVKDAVSPRTWELYRKKLEEKFKMPAEKITVDDLEEYESALKNEIFKKGEMSTFLDAYLFGMARKQGKWTGGLEELEDQLEHINSESVESKLQQVLFDDKYYRQGLETLTRFYLDQRLDSIEVMCSQSGDEKDYIMIKRNLKMARMMDSLSAIRSMVFAVGAAHLPGDSGVISLLRSKGFVVTPVISSKKISVDKYSLKMKESAWIPVAVTDSAYSLEMPGSSDEFESMKSMGIDMQAFFDIAYMKMYMTLYVDLTPDRAKVGIDSIYRSVKNRYIKLYKTVKEKNITVNGMDGREFAMSTEDNEFRIQVFVPKMERVVLNGLVCLNGKTVNDEESDRFFQSFRYNEKVKPRIIPAKEWGVQHFPVHSFRVQMPGKPEMKRDASSEEGKIVDTYQMADISNQVYYGMVITTVKTGLYWSSMDSSHLSSVKDNILATFTDTKVMDSSFFNLNGYVGYRLTVSGKVEGEQLETKAIYLNRGNRNYYIYTVYTPNESNRNTAGRYIGSFTLLDYELPPWVTLQSPDGSFSTSTPFKYQSGEFSENDFHAGATRYIVHDSVTATTNYVDGIKIPAWAWFGSDTAFLRQRVLQYKSYDDSLLNYTTGSDGKQTWAEFTLKSPSTFLVERVKLVLTGDKIYELYSHYHPRDVQIYDRFFADFRQLKEASTTNHSTPGADQLVAFMQQANREDVREINTWWPYLHFTYRDIPSLQRMLLKLYPDFDSTFSENLNSKVITALEQLDTLHTTMQFLRDNYGSIKLADEPAKGFVLQYLTGIKTAESYELIRDLLNKNSFQVNYRLPGIYYSYDSVQLVAKLFPDIMKHANSEAMGHNIIEMTTWVLDSGLLDRKEVLKYNKEFTSYIKRQMDEHSQQMEESGYEYYDYIRLLGVLNTPEANVLLSRFSKFSNKGIQYTTLITRLKNGQAVDSRTIFTLAMTDEFRHDLYDELKKMKKLNLFPVSFMTQRELGKSKLYGYATDEDAPSGVTFVAERTITYKGKQQRFYLYKVMFKDDDDYLGVAGPYSLQSKDVNSDHEVTGVYWQDSFDGKKIDALFKDYLASLEEADDEDGDD